MGRGVIARCLEDRQLGGQTPVVELDQQVSSGDLVAFGDVDGEDRLSHFGDQLDAVALQGAHRSRVRLLVAAGEQQSPGKGATGRESGCG